MQSICPTCLAQIEHEDGVTQVECSCGATFDPSQEFDDLPSLEEAMQQPRVKVTSPKPVLEKTPEKPVSPVAEQSVHAPAAMEESAVEAPSAAAPEFTEMTHDAAGFGPLEEDASEPPVGDLGFPDLSGEGGTGSVEPGSDFSEATQAFEEIREFGESVLPGSQDAPATPLATEAPPSKASPQPPAATPTGDAGGVTTAMRMTSGALLQGFTISEYFTPLSLQCAVDDEAEEPLKPAFDKLWTKAQAAGGNAVIDLKWKLSAEGKKVLISGTPVKCVKAT